MVHCPLHLRWNLDGIELRMLWLSKTLAHSARMLKQVSKEAATLTAAQTKHPRASAPWSSSNWLDLVQYISIVLPSNCVLTVKRQMETVNDLPHDFVNVSPVAP